MPFLKQILTEDDGENYCLAKVIGLASFALYHAYICYLILIGQPPHLGEYGQVTLEIMGGAGTLIACKQSTQKS
jgi:hypothetical protein